jgi:hypothetical protein
MGYIKYIIKYIIYYMQINEIIPRMIFGIVLIVGWLPVILLTERNNKVIEMKIINY